MINFIIDERKNFLSKILLLYISKLEIYQVDQKYFYTAIQKTNPEIFYIEWPKIILKKKLPTYQKLSEFFSRIFI